MKTLTATFTLNAGEETLALDEAELKATISAAFNQAKVRLFEEIAAVDGEDELVFVREIQLRPLLVPLARS